MSKCGAGEEAKEGKHPFYLVWRPPVIRLIDFWGANLDFLAWPCLQPFFPESHLLSHSVPYGRGSVGTAHC